MTKTRVQLIIIPLDRIGQELEENLGDIQILKGALVVKASNSVVSLSFLRSLSVIGGSKLLNDRCSINRK